MKKSLNFIGNFILTLLIILLIIYGWAYFEMKILLKPYPEFFGFVFFIQEDNKMGIGVPIPIISG